MLSNNFSTKYSPVALATDSGIIIHMSDRIINAFLSSIAPSQLLGISIGILSPFFIKLHS